MVMMKNFNLVGTGQQSLLQNVHRVHFFPDSMYSVYVICSIIIFVCFTLPSLLLITHANGSGGVGSAISAIC